MKDSEEMIKTSIVIILGILFYTYVMSHGEWPGELRDERVVSHPERKFSRKW